MDIFLIEERNKLQENTKNLSGIELRNYLKINYYIRTHVSYSIAEKKLKEIDTGSFYDHGVEILENENCEHIVPQSFFHSKPPMVSDLHHLYLCGRISNGIRENYKYKEIEDDNKTKWIIDDIHKAEQKPTNSDEYSAYEKNAFEPKKSSRGNVARSCAYFFTMYPEYINTMENVIDISIMKKWNEIDPVDDIDNKRNYSVYLIQKNLNPYVLCPEFVDRAF